MYDDPYKLYYRGIITRHQFMEMIPMPDRPTSVDTNPNEELLDHLPIAYAEDLKQAQEDVQKDSWVRHGEVGKTTIYRTTQELAVKSQALLGWGENTVLMPAILDSIREVDRAIKNLQHIVEQHLS